MATEGFYLTPPSRTQKGRSVLVELLALKLNPLAYVPAARATAAGIGRYEGEQKAKIVLDCPPGTCSNIGVRT